MRKRRSYINDFVHQKEKTTQGPTENARQSCNSDQYAKPNRKQTIIILKHMPLMGHCSGEQVY